MISYDFKGYPKNAESIPIPKLFFSYILPRIHDIHELKITLYFFVSVRLKKRYPRFITYKELSSDPLLLSYIDCSADEKDNYIKNALTLALDRGSLLKAKLNIDGELEDIYYINMEPDKTTFEKLLSGELVLENFDVRKDDAVNVKNIGNIYAIYEQNIGVITPLIAEELKIAEQNYPAEWIKDAIGEAVIQNKRNWKYILRILERWSEEGKDNGKIGRHFEKNQRARKYITGKYGHMVRR